MRGALASAHAVLSATILEGRFFRTCFVDELACRGLSLLPKPLYTLKHVISGPTTTPYEAYTIKQTPYPEP